MNKWINGWNEFERTWRDIDATQRYADVFQVLQDFAERRPHLSLEAEAEEGIDDKVIGRIDEGGWREVGEERDVQGGTLRRQVVEELLIRAFGVEYGWEITL